MFTTAQVHKAFPIAIGIKEHTHLFPGGVR